MITLRFKKHFFRGNLMGLTHTDSLTFVDEWAMNQWIDGVKKNEKKLGYRLEVIQ